MDATLLIDHHAHATERGTVVRALLTISGQAPSATERPPLALSLVLDRSGSMTGPKLEAVAEASARAVERLHPADLVGAVAFDQDVRTVAPPAPAAAQHGLTRALRRLAPGGMTNLSGGWLRGRQQMADAADQLDGTGRSMRRIILLTDGLANVGITEPEALVGLARTARAEGITTTTIGVGADYDDGLLRAIADAGGGNAWYIERPDQAQDVFAEELGNLLAVAAQGVTVTLTVHPPVSMLVVHSDWPATPGSDTWHFDLGDLYASQPKPLLVELFVPTEAGVAGATGPTGPLATLVIRADVLTADGGVEQRTLTLPIAATLDGQSRLEPAVEKAILLVRTASLREEAARAQRVGDAERAGDLMERATELLRGSGLLAHPEFAAELREQVDDLEALRAQYRAGAFDEHEAKYHMQRAYNTKRGKGGYDARLSRRNRGDQPTS
jgi:Ca-activated chloride channel family protein